MTNPASPAIDAEAGAAPAALPGQAAPRVPVAVFLVLFTVSGFAGLIYESIWSHYLKLFLGHAAYAQTLVLAIFMGGMAAGSWLVSRRTHRIRRPLLGYAAAELGIGVLAIVFHPVFVHVVDFAYGTILPHLGSAFAITLFKWALAALLIVPASLLLGTTFPLMSAGVVRLHPAEGPRSLAMLYFTNSLGACLGVLASGFVLIARVGLPGTMMTAGLCNIALAIAVWALVRRIEEPATPAAAMAPAAGAPSPAHLRALLAAAALTGCASFVYEIAWIRLLSLGTGSSTHAFEVMLSAFILGIALGGFAVRRRVGQAAAQPAWLVALFVAKGLLAVLALGVYVGSLDVLQQALQGLAPTRPGYAMFTLLGYAFSAAVMLPTAIVSGMALPLLTQSLLGRGWGERSIGAVYSANTAGCIAGAFLATHVGMEPLGTKGLTAAGAMLDVAAALLVLAFAWQRAPLRRLAAPLLVVLALAAAAFASARFDEVKLISGIYRTGVFLDPAATHVEFFRDGRTATVAVSRIGTRLSISTNGKPDAAMEASFASPPGPDESTMVLLGALPLALHPGARDVANIGFGSGLTTHTVLGDPHVEHVDTVEIERQMVEGARLFGERNARAFRDPRSRIVIEDAKTFFATNARRYDVIISEPSNPWVSGVASLFSDEFYARTRAYLKDDGVFVQWLQVYEINPDLVGSIFKALSRNFDDYAVYRAADADIVIIARKAGRLPAPSEAVFAMPGLAADLQRLGLRSAADLRMLRVGSRRALDPLFRGDAYAPNSDYFPVVDQNAARSRFMKENSTELVDLGRHFVPLVEAVDGEARVAAARLAPDAGFAMRPFEEARIARDRLAMVGAGPEGGAAGSVRWSDVAAHAALTQCALMGRAWVDEIQDVLRGASAPLPRAEVGQFVSRLRAGPCVARLAPAERQRLDLLLAIALRDYPAMASLADARLASPAPRSSADTALCVEAAITGHLVGGEPAAARAAWERHRGEVAPPDRSMLFRLAGAHAVAASGGR